MDHFNAHHLRKAYEEVERLGDRLAMVDRLIDWAAFLPLLQGLNPSDGSGVCRPGVDPILMVKLLVIQEWYGFSDQELEEQMGNRISFLRFLGHPKEIPDASTFRLFRERLAEMGRDRFVWEELRWQLDMRGVEVRKGVFRDVSFTAEGSDDP